MGEGLSILVAGAPAGEDAGLQGEGPEQYEHEGQGVIQNYLNH